MEEFPREELQRRVQEVGGGQPDPEPSARQPVAAEQVDGDGSERHGRDHDQVEEVGAGAEPVEGREQEQAHVEVVAEEVEAADRHEQPAHAGDQPRRLIEDAHVQAERAEAVLAQQDEAAEHGDPQCDQQRERPDLPGNRGQCGPYGAGSLGLRAGLDVGHGP